MKKTIALIASGFLLATAFSQSATFNQNASRSNHTRLLSDSWSFDLSSGASFGINNSEKSLFRGNSLATKISGRYQFGWIGLGMSGGLMPGTISKTAVNGFMTERKIDPSQAEVITGNPSNSYLLFGPSVQLGDRVQVLAGLQGGVFLNDPGNVTINQTGAQRSVYRFQGGDKNLFPGLSGSLQLAYPLNSSTRFFINSDYFYSKSSISVQDLQMGIDMPTLQNRNIQLFTAGIGLTKTFGNRDAQSGIATGKRSREAGSGLATGRRQHQPLSSREAGSGMATGRRTIAAESNAPRDAASGLATGKRYQPGQPVYGNLVNREACGPVTQKITHPDGTTEENTFACPDDALDYASKLNNSMPSRISMTPTTARQTQGSSFGEKVSTGLHAAGSRLISGKLSWSNAPTGSSAIITNTADRNAGADPNAASVGFQTKIYARDAASGRATGKRSRETGSGLATGRRQYEPMFTDGGGTACSPCMVTITSNPLYSDKGTSGQNPLHQSKTTTTANENGVAGIEVYLMDPSTNTIVAKTTTQSNGEFWFANLPDADYIIRTSGSVTMNKQYNVSIPQNKKDIAGEIVSAPGFWTMSIQTSNAEPGDDAPYSPASLKKIAIVTSPQKNEGDYESFLAIGTYSDGRSVQMASTKKGNVTVPVRSGGAASASYARMGKQGANLVGINMSDLSKVMAIFSDGSSRDITSSLSITQHASVVQYIIETEDSDGDGNADNISERIKTKSNIKNDRLMAGKDELGAEESGDQKIKTKSNIKNDRIAQAPQFGYSFVRYLPIHIADADGDGLQEAIVGGTEVSARVSGNPIGGIIVKGGKNPGGGAQAFVTNSNGEFEFTNWEAGEYLIQTQQTFYLDDEFMLPGSQQRVQDHNSSRSNKSASSFSDDGENGQPSLRAQNNNTVKSNRGNFFTILVEADLDGDGDYETDISQSHAFNVTIDENSPTQKAGVSTSRSNIRTKSALQPLGNDLYIATGTAVVNGKEVSIQSVLKTRHDTAKNSISNIR